jgi:hypothetical protein
MKRISTEADFSDLSWHDNSVHALRVIEGNGVFGQIILDLDHIVEWIESKKGYEFRVAPAELRFRDVTDLRMTLDYSATSAALTPFTLDGIQTEQMADGHSNRWTLKVNWPVGEISFSSTGFTQRLTGEPVVSSVQSLDPSRRIHYIATRELTASHPEQGEFAVSVCIGKPHRIGDDEWACGIVAARTVLGFSVPGGLQILLIAAGSLGLGYASARWGDSVWLWLGKWLRWLV